ncbi:hypothetical protein Q2T40_10530 [Winogradskyella maritima]|uniref:LTXXQ motif family protein n=1 Tax=Winogradskyella maritima TaxID=1517766 RepID=A0ABV8AMU8_9FLAO|nr:hypothetical protein [Winogradskyella maritima]
MRTLIILCIVLFTFNANAQDPMLQFNNEALEEVAYDVTTAYNKHLGMDGRQVTLFQKKVEEFLIREEKIHQNYTGKEKLDLIAELRKAETMEMWNILTQPQMEVYKKWKPTIQPIAKVKSDKD